MKFEKQLEKQKEEEILREKVRILLRAEVDPLEDKEFQRFLKRYFMTEGDAIKIIDEEREKLEAEKAGEEKEMHYLKNQ